MLLQLLREISSDNVDIVLMHGGSAAMNWLAVPIRIKSSIPLCRSLLARTRGIINGFYECSLRPKKQLDRGHLPRDIQSILTIRVYLRTVFCSVSRLYGYRAKHQKYA